MENLTWTCHVCHERRPDNCISVFTKDISGGYDLKPGTVKENIRYCNDKLECINGAPTVALGWETNEIDNEK